MPRLSILAGGSAAAALAVKYISPEYLLGSTVWTAAVLFLPQLLCLVLWRWIILPRYFSVLRDLPTAPGGSLFMGHYWALAKDPTVQPLRAWVEEIPNDGLIRFFTMFNKERVAIVSPSTLAEVLVHKCYDFEKPELFRRGLVRILGLGLVLAEGDVHKQQRKDLMPAFAFRHVKDLYPVFWNKSRELMQAIVAQTDPNRQSDDMSGISVEVNGWTSRAALDIIGVAGLGRDFGAIKDPNNSLNQTYRRMFSPDRMAIFLAVIAFFVPPVLTNRLPFNRNLEFDKMSRMIRDVCYSLVEEKRKKLQEDKHNTGIDILSVAINSGGFSDEGLVNQMMTFLVAGHETTASALTWAIYLLCKHPEMQTRLREEVQMNLPKPLDTDTPVSSTDIDNLPYLSAFCNEVFRLYPPVPVLVREASRDTTLAGHVIPKGTILLLSAWAINVSTAQWGSDAATFNPDRWMGPGNANSGGAGSNYSFLTFLHGPRSCIAQGFAKAEFSCILAAWVNTFETELADKSYVPVVASGTSAKPAGGVHVVLKRVE